MTTKRHRKRGCDRCTTRGASLFAPDITMAYQPIVDTGRERILAHEALVRAPDGGSAASVLSQVTPENRYAFDQKCRVTAIELAARLGIPDPISINFMPNAVYEPENCIQATLRAAARHDFPLENILFEVTESESLADLTHLKNIFEAYRSIGFRTAIDDFGAGYSGLTRLAELRPDLVKLDMGLIRDIDSNPTLRKIVSSIVRLSTELGITLIAEGIETGAELRCLMDLGIDKFQGYFFARPVFEGFVPFSEIRVGRSAA